MATANKLVEKENEALAQHMMNYIRKVQGGQCGAIDLEDLRTCGAVHAVLERLGFIAVLVKQ